MGRVLSNITSEELVVSDIILLSPRVSTIVKSKFTDPSISKSVVRYLA